MAREFGRNARVASELQKELALLLQRGIGAGSLGLITVNEVVLSKDLAVAKAYFTVLGKGADDKHAAEKTLNEKAPYLRSEIGKKIRLRNIPQLRFYYDDSFETGMRVAQLLSEDDRPKDD